MAHTEAAARTPHLCIVVEGVVEAAAPVAEVAADHKEVGGVLHILGQQLAIGGLAAGGQRRQELAGG